MKKFEYADEQITEREILVAIPSFVIGVGILSLPQSLASASMSADGWVSLLIGGFVALVITWAVAKFSASFPNQSFLTYASSIVSKPVGIVLTFLFAVVSFNIVALQLREIAEISKHYLLKQTPVEVISLTFLLVIIYAVSGSRAGLFRLNTMFLPFVLFIAMVVIVFNINQFDFGFMLPVFETEFRGYLEGVQTSILSYAGFGILWFYIALVKKPDKTPKMAVLGMCMPIVLYIMLFMTCILVFGNSITSNLQYPTIELAKIVEIPGGILERFESLFFVIWIMAIFNTTAMALDIAVLAINSIFKNTAKIKIIFILAPVVYVISMYPQDTLQISSFGTAVSYSAFLYTIFVIILLFSIAKIRGVK